MYNIYSIIKLLKSQQKIHFLEKISGIIKINPVKGVIFPLFDEMESES